MDMLKDQVVPEMDYTATSADEDFEIEQVDDDPPVPVRAAVEYESVVRTLLPDILALQPGLTEEQVLADYHLYGRDYIENLVRMVLTSQANVSNIDLIVSLIQGLVSLLRSKHLFDRYMPYITGFLADLDKMQASDRMVSKVKMIFDTSPEALWYKTVSTEVSALKRILAAFIPCIMMILADLMGGESPQVID